MKLYFNVLINAKNMEQYLSINKALQEIVPEKSYFFSEKSGFSLYSKKSELKEINIFTNIYVTQRKMELPIKEISGNNRIEILPESIKDSQTLETLINEGLKDKIKKLGL